MSQNNSQVPSIVVIGTTPPHPTYVTTPATPVYATEVGNNTGGTYAIPIYAQSVQPISDHHNAPIYTNSMPIQTPRLHFVIDSRQLPENVTTVYSLSRSLKCLTIVDTITIIISSIWNLFWLFFIWGPIAGFYGVTKYQLYFVYCYAIYWILRILVDLLYVFTGYWWHIVLLIIDLYILRYVRIHILAMRSLTYEQLQMLREIQNTPNDGNTSEGTYFSRNA